MKEALSRVQPRSKITLLHEGPIVLKMAGTPETPSPHPEIHLVFSSGRVSVEHPEWFSLGGGAAFVGWLSRYLGAQLSTVSQWCTMLWIPLAFTAESPLNGTLQARPPIGNSRTRVGIRRNYLPT